MKTYTLNKRNRVFYFIVLSLLLSANLVFASGFGSATAYPDEHCIRKNKNSGAYNHIYDYMSVGQTTLYYYRGLLIFSTTDVPDNSIITGHDVIYVSLWGDPPSEDFNVRAMQIVKNPYSTSADQLYADCYDGTVYKELLFNDTQTQDYIPQNTLVSNIQDNLESNWTAFGLVSDQNQCHDFISNYMSIYYYEVDITNVQVTNITHNSARITWNTTPNSWTYLRYKRKNFPLDPWIEYKNESFVYNHIVDLTGLSADTEYEYKIGIRILEYNCLNKAAYKSTFKTEKIRTITVISPNGGNLILKNSNYNITWSSQNVEHNVKIEFSSNGGNSWSTVVDNLPNSGSYNWTVPNIVSESCKIKISDITGFPKDESDGLFTIHTITTSGTLPTSERWSSSVNIIGNVTVPTNKILYIGPSVTVSVVSGKKLIINGTLDAQETIFQPSSSSWYGIEMNATASGSLIYCTVKYAQCGIRLYNTSIDIWHSSFSDNTKGIKYENQGGGFLWYNTFENYNATGIECVQYSCPSVRSYNGIWDHYYGVKADNTSLPDLGNYAGQGYNSIYNVVWDVYSTNPNSLNAQYNWWGSATPSPSLYGNIVWQPYLNFDPVGGGLKKSFAENNDTQKMAESINSADTTGIQEFEKAYSVYLAEDYGTALNLFDALVAKYPDFPVGRQSLAFENRCLENLGRANEALAIMNAMATKYSGKEISGLAQSIAVGHLVKLGNYQEAITKSDQILHAFPD